MMQINRLFEMIYILLHKKRVTAKELAEQFGVSTRTIYRDIDTLSLVGIPVYALKGKNGGISLLPDYVLDKSILSEKEQSEILAALYGFANISPDETDRVLRKLSTFFNKTATNWIEADFSDWSWANNYFNDFKTAILQRRIAEFDYYNRQGEKTFRRIEPMLLWFKSKSWYIRGFCLTKQDMRLYKLSRVKNLVVTGEHFEQRDFADFNDDAAHEQHEEPAFFTVKLRIAPEMAYRVFDEFGESAVEKQPDGSFIATAIWSEDNWVYGFILSFGEYAEVLEPPHIRETLKNKVKNIYEKY